MKSKIHPLAKKLGYNSNESFYLDFPTQEAYNQFQMGGTLPPKQKFEMGGIPPIPEVTTPPVVTTPVTTTVPSSPAQAAMNADNANTSVAAPDPVTAKQKFKLPDMSGVSTGGQQAPQQAGADPNAPVQKNIGKTIGSVAGGIAGSFIPIPGVGTMIGGAVGGAIGGAIDKKTYQNKMEEYSANKSSQQNAMTSNINGNFNPNAQGKQFKMGGNFTEYHGNTHENGGIPIGKSEVEGGETNHNGYIFSDTLQLGKRTFADVSKKINNKYSRRPDDKISMESKERELGNLMKVQESTGMTNNSQSKFQYGGPNWMKNINNLTNQANNPPNYTPSNYAPTAITESPTGFYTTDDINSNKEAVGNIANTLVTQPTNKAVIQEAIENERSRVGLQTTSPTLSKSSTPSTPLKPSDTNKPLQTSVNPLGYLASTIGPAYNIAQGLKGGDPVNFDRMNTKYQYADPREAMAAASRGITSGYNAAKNAARNTTTSAGEYLANMGNLTSKEGMDRAAAVTGIKGQYDTANTQGLNQTNLTKDQFNAQVQMRESIAQQEEKDAGKNSIGKGFDNFGQNTLGYGQDLAMNKTQNTMLPLLADGYEYVIDADGKVSSRKKISTNDPKTPLTQLT